MFIGREQAGRFFAVRYLKGQNLLAEAILSDRLQRLLLARPGEIVHRFAGNTEALRDVFRRDAVVIRPFWPGKDGDQSIFQLAVAHAIAIARFAQVVGQLGHIFRSAGDDHLGLAALQLHHAVRQGLKPGAALAVNRIRGALLRDPRPQLADAGDKTAFGDLPDVADDRFIDILRRKPGAGDRFANNRCPEIVLVGMLKTAVKRANSGTNAADNHNIISLCHRFSPYSTMPPPTLITSPLI